MLTEHDARRLLHLAAETIEVTPVTTHQPQLRDRRALIAAGAALAVAATVAMVFLLPGNDRRTEPTSPPSPEPSGSVLEADQIPSVFGMTGDQARRILADRGLAATVKLEPTCAEVAGRALRTEPTTGARFHTGGRVTVLVASTPATAACKSLEDRELAWEFVDWANGRGQPPAFADPVSSYTNDQDPVGLNAAQAISPAAWGSDAAPAELARSSAEVMPVTTNGRTDYHTPVLGVTPDDGRDFVCGGWELPSPLDRRRSIMVGIGIPLNRPGSELNCLMVNLFVTDGRIDTVVLRRWGLADVDPQNSQPTQPDSDEVSADAEQVGATFVAFASGKATSGDLFAAEVALWLGNRPITTIDAASASTDRNWDICPREGDVYAEAVCPFSALEAVRESRWPVIYQARHPFLGACAVGDRDAELPDGRFVVLGVPEPDACLNNWNVELYYDADRRITAVNLLHGSP